MGSVQISFHEASPLLGVKTIQPEWGIWHITSPSHRFFLLFFICLIPFGGHFVKNEMSALEPLMLNDTEFPISNTMYGALNSAVSIPNMIIPFFGGHILDCKGHMSILYFLLLMCIGQTIFTYAMSAHNFWCAMVGRVIFGIGEGSVVAGARAILSFWFDRAELTCAMGVMIAITNVSKMLAKSTVAPVAIFYGSYTYGLIYGLLVCVVCNLFALVVVNSTKSLKKLRRNIQEQCQAHHTDVTTLIDPQLHWLTKYCQSTSRHQGGAKSRGACANHSISDFSIIFWLVVVLHVIFINAFHLFQNISSSYLSQVHGYSIVDAGIISSLSHAFVLVAPFVGLLIDYVGGRMVVIVTSCFIGVVAYVLLIFTSLPPLVSMLLFSLCLAATPTILMASIPLSISKHRFGIAFGLVEVIDAVGAFSGNLGIGYLRDTTGSYDAVMYVLLGLTAFAFILSVLLAWVDNLHGGNLSSATVNIPLVAPDTPPQIVQSSSSDELPSVYL